MEEQRRIEVSFPADYGYKKWAGRRFHSCSSKRFKEKILPRWTTNLQKTWAIIHPWRVRAKLKGDIEKERIVLEQH